MAKLCPFCKHYEMKNLNERFGVAYSKYKCPNCGFLADFYPGDPVPKKEKKEDGDALDGLSALFG